ncbi:MAG: HD domain-containing protein [Candidatus Omnitrophota bacterium]
MIFNCPGAQKFRQPQPEDIKCPFCCAEIEIWTDEIQVRCPKCKKNVLRQGNASCLDWCRYAKECVGPDTYGKYMQNKAVTVKEKLLNELEGYFGGNIKKINHARNVMHFAEELLKREKADWHIVIPASILHDIGAKSELGCQKKKDTSIARGILLKLGLKIDDINQICEIIAYHHSPGEVDTDNFKVLYDADCLVNLKDMVDIKDKTKTKALIDKAFFTPAAKALAGKVYLSRTSL